MWNHERTFANSSCRGWRRRLQSSALRIPFRGRSLHLLEPLLGNRIQTLETTTKTLNDFKQQIPWILLSRTFQDAITFVRRLGMNYIWIDSLCIIQDDRIDWEREAAKMGDIYMSSYLTLSATRSRSSSEGCFAGTPSAKLTGIDSHGQTYEVYARRLINHFRFLTASKTDFLSYPLFERSWCYQERLLSPRILHFGPQELFFECLEDCKCECQWMQKIGSSFSSVPKRSHTNALLGRTVFDAQRRWYDIVSVYSALKLTRPSDRLPALSGIAKQVQDCGMGQYYAGLWEVTVLEDLLWSVSPENAADPRPLAWRAPSWSWASVDTAVGYGRRATVKERYAHAIDIKTSPASVDPTGAVHAGHIILKGQVAPVIVFGPSQEEQMYALRPLHGSGYVMLYPDSAKDIQNNQILYYMKILTYAPDHMLLLIMVRSDPITQTYTRVGISDAYLEDDQSWVEQVFCGSNERVVTIE